MLARRFAGPYLARAPREPWSMTEVSERLATGEHGFASGGLLALWLDQRMRERTPDDGLREAMLDLSATWLDHSVGIPESRFEPVLASVVGLDLGPLFARHVHGRGALPVSEILAGAGIEISTPGGANEVRDGAAGFRVLEVVSRPCSGFAPARSDRRPHTAARLQCAVRLCAEGALACSKESIER